MISLPAQRQFLLNFGLIFFFFLIWTHHSFGYLHGHSEVHHEGTALEPGEAITRPPQSQFSKTSQRGDQVTNHCRSIYELGELSNFEKLAEFISGMRFSRPINIQLLICRIREESENSCKQRAGLEPPPVSPFK